jgi:anion-transporting  ArsA/GET3 family ATPase
MWEAARMKARAPKVLLEGRPGVGKTTVVQRLAAALAEGGVPVGGFLTDELKGRKDVEVIQVSRDNRGGLPGRLNASRITPWCRRRRALDEVLLEGEREERDGERGQEHRGESGGWVLQRVWPDLDGISIS